MTNATAEPAPGPMLAADGRPLKASLRRALRAQKLRALLLVLLLSGTVRGEVGRIWLFLMPFACVLAAADAARRWPSRSFWSGLLLVLEIALTLVLAANLVFVG